jgi:hypothetical protein
MQMPAAACGLRPPEKEKAAPGGAAFFVSTVAGADQMPVMPSVL